MDIDPCEASQPCRENRNLIRQAAWERSRKRISFFRKDFMEYFLSVNDKTYTVVKLLGHGKGGYSYLVTLDGRLYVLKQIHHEPCDYYTFGDKLAAECGDYEKLLAAGIPIPRLLEVDTAQERILKEYICGPTVMELTRQGLLREEYILQGQQMAAQAKAAGLNIDFYPTNFVLQKGKLYYIDYECNPYMDRWSFEAWGSSYWKNQSKEENP